MVPDCRDLIKPLDALNGLSQATLQLAQVR